MSAANSNIAGLPTRRKSRRVASPDWLDGAQVDDRERPIPNLHNACIVLRSAPEAKKCFAFDEMERLVMIEDEMPLARGAISRVGSSVRRPLADPDVAQLQEWMQSDGLPKISRETVQQAIVLRAQECGFHPVRQYLEALEWDKTPRLSGWLSRYLRVHATKYSSAIGRMFMIGAVARIFSPGCKMDYALILEGAQGTFKSTASAILAGPWFSDQLPDLKSKDASQHLRGKWFVELAELATIRRAETELLKSYMTRTTERYRSAYGRGQDVEPRQSVFIGTTNSGTYLKDDTGNRRFWPVKVVAKIDIAALKADRDQLFAEAVVAFHHGECWWPTQEFESTFIQQEQAMRLERDPWHDAIEEYVSDKTSVLVGEVALGALLLEIKELRTAPEQRRTVRGIARSRLGALRKANLPRPALPQTPSAAVRQMTHFLYRRAYARSAPLIENASPCLTASWFGGCVGIVGLFPRPPVVRLGRAPAVRRVRVNRGGSRCAERHLIVRPYRLAAVGPAQ